MVFVEALDGVRALENDCRAALAGDARPQVVAAVRAVDSDRQAKRGRPKTYSTVRVAPLYRDVRSGK